MFESSEAGQRRGGRIHCGTPYEFSEKKSEQSVNATARAERTYPFGERSSSNRRILEAVEMSTSCKLHMPKQAGYIARPGSGKRKGSSDIRKIV